MLFYTLLLAGVYTALPYKTPWCMLGFLHGFILLAGGGLDAIISGARRPLTRLVAAIAVLACAWPLVTQAERVISRKFAADNRNPYVYAHTVNDLLNLAGWIDQIAAVHPLGRDLPIHVCATADDFWPLPWYLRRYRNVGYWSKVPDAADAAVVVISSDLAEDFESMRRNEYPTQAHYGLRPGTVLSAYIDADTWKRFRAAQPSANVHADDKP
ncbi:MAG: hypothetical protein HZB38_09725 [Planctomycetes bacterium]|nr:hypothetical protein [Planctomycetota bacterium]